MGGSSLIGGLLFSGSEVFGWSSVGPVLVLGVPVEFVVELLVSQVLETSWALCMAISLPLFSPVMETVWPVSPLS